MFRHVILIAGVFSLTHASVADQTDSATSAPLTSASWGTLLKEAESVIFCTRSSYADPHWYANFGYYCDDEQSRLCAGNGGPDDGKLCRLNLATKELTVLLDALGGSVRDPQVHYDGGRILFSYRPAKTDFYHLYEINADGTGLRQITSGDFDDTEPCYLPDGDIAFVSSRCKRWVECWSAQVGTLFRCDVNGRRMRALSSNTIFDNTPWMLPDGRLLYMRWEYVDRNHMVYHHLWTMNPDGTGVSVYYGNMNGGGVLLDAKPIPGTRKVIASFSPGHGMNEHDGIATVYSQERGPDDPSVPRALHGGPLTRDPYALTENCFLMARGKQLVLMDDKGGEEVIYTYAGAGGLHEPRPLRPRPREAVLPDMTKPQERVGRMVLEDVYCGREMEGIAKGDIRQLLILETLPRPVSFWRGLDGYEMLTWCGTFNIERVLGTVPVEEDGSAHFEVPAHRPLFFVALDANGLSVKRMQSFCNVMPGETLGCVGCHERRVQAPHQQPYKTSMLAVKRPASKIKAFEGLPDVVDFSRDIQPILYRHCIRCHDHGKREGKTVLSGDLGYQWSHSYFTLFARGQVADGRNGSGNQPPRTIGSSASPLMKKIDGSHHGVKLAPAEWRTVWLWIESGATYAGSYAALRTPDQQKTVFSTFTQVMEGERELLQRRCAQCHAQRGLNSLPYDADVPRRTWLSGGRGDIERTVRNDLMGQLNSFVLLNLSRPEYSPLLLGPLAKEAGGYGNCGAVFKDKNDPDYQRLLGAIRGSKEVFDKGAPWGTPGFKPNRHYFREMKRFGVLPESFDPAKDAIDFFAIDQRYWKSFWHQPE